MVSFCFVEYVVEGYEGERFARCQGSLVQGPQITDETPSPSFLGQFLNRPFQRHPTS